VDRLRIPLKSDGPINVLFLCKENNRKEVIVMSPKNCSILILAVIIQILSCKDRSTTKTIIPGTRNSANSAGSIRKPYYCRFYTTTLYNDFQFGVSVDTISTFHYGTLTKTWFTKNGQQFATEHFSSKDLRELNSNEEELIVEPKHNTIEFRYSSLSKDLKKEIGKLIPGIDYDKIQQSGDHYFLTSKPDSNYHQSVYAFDSKEKKIDTIMSNIKHPESRIAGFFLYDFNKDGHIDIFIFSIDTLHDDGVQVDAFTVSPDSPCLH
jgi:hypothetical protein